MAEKTVIIKAKLDTSESVANIEKLKRGLKEIKPSGVDEQFAAINKRMEAGNLTLTEMRKLTKEYQNVALQAGQTTPIGQEALKRAGELKDRMNDVRNQLLVMAQDGKAMNAAVTISKTALAGYQSFIGIAQLASGENKKLVETMSKMMIITQSLQAVEQVANQFRKGSVLTTYAMATAYKVLGVSAEAASGGVRTLTKALVATGIGAILTAVGLLIGYFNDIVNWLGSIWDKVKQLSNTIPILKPIVWTFEQLGRAVKWVKELFTGLTEEQEKLLKTQQKIIEQTDDIVKATESKYNRIIKIAEAEGKDTYELERRKTLAIINLYKEQLNAYAQMKRIQGELDVETARKALETAEKLRDMLASVRAMDIKQERKLYEERQRAYEEWLKNRLVRLRGEIEELAAILTTRINNEKFYADLEVSINKKMLNDKRAEDYSYHEEVKKLAALEKQYRLDVVKNAGAAFTALAGLMREGSKAQKAAALAGLIADEAASISSAVAAASTASAQAAKNPATILFPALPTVIWASTYLSIAAGIARTIAQAKQILGAGSSSIPLGVSAPSPGGGSFAGAEAEPTVTYNVNTQTVNTSSQARVVVVEHDITRVQQNVNYIKKISVI